jgi:hypothetical protein
MPSDREANSDRSRSATDFAAALEQARAERIPVMALRPDHRFPEEMDDVVVKHVETLHFEAMSNTCWWMACHFANGEEAVFHFTIGKNPKRVVVTCDDQPAVWRDWDALYHETHGGQG